MRESLPVYEPLRLSSVVMFDDLIEGNQRYAESFELGELKAPAARGLAVVTCIDSRIEPLQMLGLKPGDAKILRNAGARVTEDVLRSLVLATNLLNVSRICIVQHTDCAVAKSSNEDFQTTIGKLRGTDASSWDFLAINDQQTVLTSDVKKVEECELIPQDVTVAGFIYDVKTGKLNPA